MTNTLNEYVDIITERKVFKGFFEFKTFDLKYKRFDGKMSKTVNREVFFGKEAVVIIPYDPINDEVIFVEQIRFASAIIGDDSYYMEIPAGVIDGNDSPLESVKRELKEETGVVAKEIIPVYDYFPSPGCTTEHLWFYCGIINANEASSFAGLEEEGEDIKVHKIKYDEVVKMLENNKLRNSNTLLAVQWLMLNRERLRNQYK